MHKQRFISLISAILSLLVLVWIFTRLDWLEMRQVLAQVSPQHIFLAFLTFIVTYLFRTLRFQLLLRPRSGQFVPLFGITALYGFFTYFLPVQTGEFSYLLLLKRYHQVALTTSAVTLVAARFFDFATIASLLPLVLLAFWSQLSVQIRLTSLVFCLAVYLGLGIIPFLLRQQKDDLAPMSPVGQGWRARGRNAWQRFVAGVQVIKKRQLWGKLWFLTLGIWLSIYGTLYFIVRSLGYQPTYFQVMVVSMVMIPLALVPVQGFANLGTHELAWVSVFTLFGYSPSSALTIATGSHLVLIAFILVSGSLGWFIVHVVGKRHQDEKG